MQFKSYIDNEDGSRTYKTVIYDNLVDRAGDKATHQFLEELAIKMIGKPILKNHEHNVDDVVGRIVDACVKAEGDYEYIEADLSVREQYAIEKIEKELYKEVSASFDAEQKREEDYVSLLSCTDAYEVSFVAVPCLRGASIKLKSFIVKGDKNMLFKGFKKKKLMAEHPVLKSLEPEVLDAVIGEGDVEITESDIEALLSENEHLKSQIKSLEDELASFKENEEVRKDNETILAETEKAIEGLDMGEEVKDVVREEAKESIENGDITLDKSEESETKVKGLNEFIDKTVKKYTKLGLVGVKKSADVAKKVETKDFKFSAVQEDEENKQKCLSQQVTKKGFID